MQKLIKAVSTSVILLVLTLSGSAQTRTYQGNYQAVRQLILRIETSTGTFRQNLDYALNRNRVNDSNQQRELLSLALDFDNAVRTLRSNVERRRENTADVQLVLDRASQIDDLLSRSRVSNRIQTTWSDMRPDLDDLARRFRLSWGNGDRGQSGSYSRSNQLSGTYRLDPSRSDDPNRVADSATQGLSSLDRQRVRDQLTRRLASPDEIAIDRRGQSITIASSRAPQIVFEADGSERIESTADGRTIRARATLSGDQLSVSTTGDRANQFTVTFIPLDNGQRLRVTRGVYIQGLNRAVEVQSVYDKTSDVARFDIYRGQGSPSNDSNSDFIVNDREMIIGELNDLLSTATAHAGDRFTITVRDPARFAGATIEGQVTNVKRSGRLTGRAEMTLNFDTIRLRDGRTYRFAGVLESVQAPGGDVVQVDNEGSVRDDSQTSKTAERTAIGTAVGAIIGAIAGGGKGAAIGAIIGAGGGAGSVYVQGKDDLELARGTEIRIRASAPAPSNPSNR